MTDSQQPTPGLHVFTNGTEYVVASNAADAIAVYVEAAGDIEPEHGPLESRPDGEPLTIHDEDGPETNACGEWARRIGRGFWFSTEG